jgi:hypothetical protein
MKNCRNRGETRTGPSGPVNAAKNPTTNEPVTFTTSVPTGKNSPARSAMNPDTQKSRSSPNCAAEHYQNITEHKKLLRAWKKSSAHAVFRREFFRARRQTPLPCSYSSAAACRVEQSRLPGRAGAQSHLEAFAQIKLATDGIVDEEILSAFTLDAPIVNQIRAVHDGKRLAHVVVSDHDG